MEYAILKSHSAEELEKRVNLFLEEGFEPSGGISVTSESTDCRYQNLYCQAVVKPDKVDVGPTPPDPVVPDPDKPNPGEDDPKPNPDPGEDGTDPIEGDEGPDEGDTESKEDDNTSNLGNLRLFK